MQVLNHFPTYYELCRKDHMAKNIKKYKKQLIKENKNTECLDFLPMTFVLPGDMSVFLEEFKKWSNSLWILKPSNRSQGQGIVLVNKINKVKKPTRSIYFNPKAIISRVVKIRINVSLKKLE